MLKDVTIGQYYPAQSLLHHLDPRTKMVFILFFMISLFSTKSSVGYLFIGIITSLLIGLSKVPVKFILKGLKPLMILISFTFLIHLFFTAGNIIFSFGPLKITLEGLRQGIFITLRLIYLILVTSLLTLTTTPMSLTDGIEKLLTPLKRVGFPAHELALMITIALRFIPTLIDETEKIMKAQKGRGVEFDKGSIIKRSKSLVSILVPLIVSCFRRAHELALAMESRCYRGGEGRTKLKELKHQTIDYLGYLSGLILVALSLLIRFSV